MDHMWARVGSQLLARVSGPMKFRLVLQPLISSFFAIRSGLATPRLASRRTSGLFFQIPVAVRR
jgi:hypothetical protein